MSIGGIDFSNADRRVTIQKPTENRDGDFNQLQYGWEDVTTVWAILTAPVFNRNNENDIADKTTAARRNRYIIRYSSDVSSISEKWRLLDGAETYMIGDVSVRRREGFIRLEGSYDGVAT